MAIYRILSQTYYLFFDKFCIFFHYFFQTNHINALGGIMKRLLIGMALGVATGMIVSEIPQVQKMLNKGKKKVKEIAK